LIKRRSRSGHADDEIGVGRLSIGPAFGAVRKMEMEPVDLPGALGAVVVEAARGGRGSAPNWFARS
jgi:hypothetical protein